MAKYSYATNQIHALPHAARSYTILNDAVLITGEPGTDKERLARTIHVLSERGGEFVSVNCATLADTLFESQLFGHRKTRLNRDVQNHPGFVRQAAGGTL